MGPGSVLVIVVRARGVFTLPTRGVSPTRIDKIDAVMMYCCGCCSPSSSHFHILLSFQIIRGKSYLVHRKEKKQQKAARGQPRPQTYHGDCCEGNAKEVMRSVAPLPFREPSPRLCSCLILFRYDALCCRTFGARDECLLRMGAWFRLYRPLVQSGHEKRNTWKYLGCSIFV